MIIERKSERILEQKEKISCEIFNKLLALIQRVKDLTCEKNENYEKKILMFVQIYQLINTNFHILYETQNCMYFFYIAFQKRQEIKTEFHSIYL